MNEIAQRNLARQAYLEQAIRFALQSYSIEFKSVGVKPEKKTDWEFVRCSGGIPRLAVAKKIENLYRSPPFRHAIGDTILRFKSDAKIDPEQDRLVVAAYFDRYSSKAVDDLRDYSSRFLDNQLNWILVASDGRGHACLLGEEKELKMERELALPALSNDEPSPLSLFSPRNQWLLKCLLLPGLVHGRYWQGPASRPTSVTELAKVSGVSQPAVSSFLNRAESAGFLRRRDRGFVMLKHRELLEEWSYAFKARPFPSVGVRPLYGDEPAEKFIERVESYCRSDAQRARVAVGSHLACAILGEARSSYAGTTIYVREDFDEVQEGLQLVPDNSDHPWAKLVRPRFPAAVFGGAVTTPEFRVPLADILQIYLDVRVSLARGMEQAESIYHRVLSPHFQKDASC